MKKLICANTLKKTFLFFKGDTIYPPSKGTATISELEKSYNDMVSFCKKKSTMIIHYNFKCI